MRAEVIDYIGGLNLGGFILSQELPWEESGTPLFLKNLKKIYVDVVSYDTEPLIQTFSGLNINNETSTVRIYFSCDAKQLPANYDDVVTELKTVKDLTALEGFQTRQANVSTDIANDVLSTTVEVIFTKIST